MFDHSKLQFELCSLNETILLSKIRNKLGVEFLLKRIKMTIKLSFFGFLCSVCIFVLKYIQTTALR